MTHPAARRSPNATPRRPPEAALTISAGQTASSLVVEQRRRLDRAGGRQSQRHDHLQRRRAIRPQRGQRQRRADQRRHAVRLRFRDERLHRQRQPDCRVPGAATAARRSAAARSSITAPRRTPSSPAAARLSSSVASRAAPRSAAWPASMRYPDGVRQRVGRDDPVRRLAGGFLRRRRQQHHG